MTCHPMTAQKAGLLILLTSGLALAACTDDQGLALARARWHNQHLTSYRVDWKQSVCFCGEDSERAKRISVVNDAVAGGVYLDNSQPVDLRADPLRTIDETFDWLEMTLADGVGKLEVQYDPVLHYPTSIMIDHDVKIADDEDTYRITDLVAD